MFARLDSSLILNTVNGSKISKVPMKNAAGRQNFIQRRQRHTLMVWPLFIRIAMKRILNGELQLSNQKKPQNLLELPGKHELEGVRANLGMAKKVTISKKSTIFFSMPMKIGQNN